MNNRVLISVATKGTIRAETSAWIVRACAEPTVGYDPVIDPRPLEHVRNLQVHRFLATDFTHLFFLDSDCLPPDRVIEKLLSLDLPIVTAPHLTAKGDEVGPMVVDRVTNGYIQHQPIVGLQKCDAVGGSGLLIRREVFEKLGPPWFRFLYNEDGYLVKGEDFYFCERAVEAGYEIWADCDLLQVQFKQRVITPNDITKLK